MSRYHTGVILLGLLLCAGVILTGGCAWSPAEMGLPEQEAAIEAAPALDRYPVTGKVLAVTEERFTIQDTQGRVRQFPVPVGMWGPLYPGCWIKLVYQQDPAGGHVQSMQVIEPATLPERAAAILAGMTLEEKVGQLFLARCPKEEGADWVDRLHLGGYILFDRDFQGRTPEQVREVLATYQQAASIPLFIAVDEEGGTVVRASRDPAFRETPFPGPQQLYQAGGWEAIGKDTEEKCAFLRDLGINLNLAPVADVSQDPDDFIYCRTLGKNGAETAQYVAMVVEIMGEQKIGSTLKHFPGYGNNLDTHTGMVLDQRTYQTLQEQDLLPFQAGIAAGATMVMVSHNTVACLDPDHPASLSPAVLALLRQDLGFQGIAITDDLAMAAATGWSGDYSPAVQAILAGEDMLCSSDFVNDYEEVLAAAADGTIPTARLDQAVLRILQAKLRLGLLK